MSEQNFWQIFKAKQFRGMVSAGLLATALTFSSVSLAQAVEFKGSGEFLFGFALGENSLVNKVDGQKVNSGDQFGAGQRVRLQLDAVASESLSGTIFFEIGDQFWGVADHGAAIGADGQIVEVKNAYLDWQMPDSDLKLRMGLQGFALPSFAGGSAIIDADSAAVVANYSFSDQASLSLFWLRPLNDNHVGTTYLDNMDLFGLTLPLDFEALSLHPWAMYGFQGKNVRFNQDGIETKDGDLAQTLGSYYSGFNVPEGEVLYQNTGNAYGTMFWVGLPVQIKALDPLNIEFDLNYGQVDNMGKYAILKKGTEEIRASSMRAGWLAKALVEYKLDWGKLGIFGWYGSGDDGNVKNGSERLPSLNGNADFSSFFGTADADWSAKDGLYERTLTLDGTWGLGFKIEDVSFAENFSHTFRILWWNGTNSPAMVKYMNSSIAWNEGDGACTTEGPYLTTNDSLVELNLASTWQVGDNLQFVLDLGYVFNMIDKKTWERSYIPDRFTKADIWKANLTLAYSF